ncbi:MAG: YfhO family protein [Elusimicrobia bacterium]|nr:YfhO family protein [Elusimicrobiota bacterium]
MIGKRDAAVLLVVAALPALLLAPTLAGSQVYFINDLTHATHPWRTLTAELLQKGQAPLWNPYSSFGLPLAGNLQTALFDPASVLFHFFPFVQALSPYLLLMYWLAAFWAYLWLRRLGASPAAAGGGAIVFAAGGTMVSHIQFPNLVASLAWGPALFLFTGRLALVALAAGLGLLAGYPPILAGLAGVWLVLAQALEGRSRLGRSLLGLAAGLALAGVVLVPGMELAARSHRMETMSAKERVSSGMKYAEFLSIVHPELLRLSLPAPKADDQAFHVKWRYEDHSATFTFLGQGDPIGDPAGPRYLPHLSGYFGVMGTLAACIGLALLMRRRPATGLLVTACVAATLFICLGKNSPASFWLWTHAPYLKQLRHPPRMHFLLLAPVPLLIGAGLTALSRRKRAAAAILLGAMAVELTATGWRFQPTIAADYFAEKGPLVKDLQEHLGASRYFMLPKGEIWPLVERESDDPRWARLRDAAYRSYKQKLFGLANLPFHLASATGVYEPLVPAESEIVAKMIEKNHETTRLAAMLAWTGCRFVLSKDELPPYVVGHEAALLPGRLLDRGLQLWRIYETPDGKSRARWLPEKEAQRLRERDVGGIGEVRGTEWSYKRLREDRFDVEGEAPEGGAVFVAEPFFPGWKAYSRGKTQPFERALGAFLQVRVPKGFSRLIFVYRPVSFVIGVAVTLATLFALILFSLRLHRRSSLA